MHRPNWSVVTGGGRLCWDVICAAIRDDVDTLREHLRDNPECARKEFWYTPPIHFAVREGNSESTRLLWEAHPHEGVTQLIRMAEGRGHTEVADYLRGAVGVSAATSDLRLHEGGGSGRFG